MNESINLYNDQVESRRDSRSRQTHFLETWSPEVSHKDGFDSSLVSSIWPTSPALSRTLSSLTDQASRAYSKNSASPNRIGVCSPTLETPVGTLVPSRTSPDSLRSRCLKDRWKHRDQFALFSNNLSSS